MKKKTLMWMTILVFLAISFGGLINRWKAEANNSVFEMVVPFEELFELTDETTLTLDGILPTLKDAGLTTVSFNPVTLSELEKQKVIQIFDEVELKEALLFTDYRTNLPLMEKGLYVTIPESPVHQSMIEHTFNPETVTIGDIPFYFLPKNDDLVPLTLILGYNEEAIEKVKSYGLHIILRGKNENPTNNGQMLEKMLELKDDKTNGILFSGMEALGYPITEEMVSYGIQLQEAGYHLYSIEFNNLKGLLTMARTTGYDTVRLHSLDLAGSKTIEELIDQAVRAIKERNIRSIFFHVDTNDPEKGLAGAIEFLQGVRDQAPENLTLGIPAPFEKIPVTSWNVLFVFAAGILFTYLASSLVRIPYVPLVAVAGMSLLAFMFFLLDRLLFIQLFALAIAIITPTFAVVSVLEEEKWNQLNLTGKYLQALGISVIGIIIIVGLLNGNGFVSGFELFRGVKLVYIGPIALVALHVFWNDFVQLWKKHGIQILQLEVRFWHLLLIALIVGGGTYYLLRSGNSGTVSEWELLFRNTLEDMLYVRPRTKEFLIGFPLFVFALHIFKRNILWGKILIIFGTIGFLSIVNTFTHLHIPLWVSMLRTLYSALIGFGIGLLLIFFYEIVTKWVKRSFHKANVS
ncbi:DUF5693 family protein [Fervidibacillus halotolerans]|uniref:DUF5693 family protein n=1 Tax=Fervidibacillus halotolerans TaxID=2980027 RepID=A0A9E8RZZ8_9BACI|nr:DUF5693 family protein [Fervidibacillus halotolerans]WAA12137.1 DUF5693 family protein [Fervidibacillus halotolerans]